MNNIQIKIKRKPSLLSKIFNEFSHFKTYPRNMQVLLITNMLYSFVLPIVELFIGAYIMRNTQNVVLVVNFQLTLYTGIPLTFLLNGYLLRKIPIKWLYSFGMLLSGVSMAVMMSIENIEFWGIVLAGLIMGLSYGFFWANRDFLALSVTNDENRNYYFGLETFFYTTTGVIVPYCIGAFIGATENGILDGDVNLAYKIITVFVFILTIIASSVTFTGKFKNPKKDRFIFFKFHKLWQKMMGLSVLKGIAQGYIVTAPAMLIMTLVGNEEILGIVQSTGAIISALLLYLLGRIAKPKHRLIIFSTGLLLFALGGVFNAILYSAIGVILFMLFLVLGRPLMDLAYFPIQMRVIDYVSKVEGRNTFSYIFVHEFGLYLGRFIGLGLFIMFAYLISNVFALRYALVIIGLAQLLSIVIAKNITNSLNKLETK